MSDEWPLYSCLLDLLAIVLRPTYHYLHFNRPSFEEFEQWVVAQHGSTLPVYFGTAEQCLA